MIQAILCEFIIFHIFNDTIHLIFLLLLYHVARGDQLEQGLLCAWRGGGVKLTVYSSVTKETK